MPQIEMNPIEFITIGTVGPKGKRQFNLQASDGSQMITMIMEKEQARRMSQVISELLNEIERRNPERVAKTINLNDYDMDLREPITPLFRIGQMGIGYDEDADLVYLEVRELPMLDLDDEDDDAENPEDSDDVQIVRFAGSREQYQALAVHSERIVNLGRPDPKQNGYMIYYWS